jgi:hypothetical protein
MCLGSVAEGVGFELTVRLPRFLRDLIEVYTSPRAATLAMMVDVGPTAKSRILFSRMEHLPFSSTNVLIRA